MTHYWRASTSSGFGSNSPIELNKWISNHTFITVFTTRPQYTSAIAIMFGKLRVITSSRVIIKLLLLLPIDITDYIQAITVVIRLPYHTPILLWWLAPCCSKSLGTPKLVAADQVAQVFLKPRFSDSSTDQTSSFLLALSASPCITASSLGCFEKQLQVRKSGNEGETLPVPAAVRGNEGIARVSRGFLAPDRNMSQANWCLMIDV